MSHNFRNTYHLADLWFDPEGDVRDGRIPQTGDLNFMGGNIGWQVTRTTYMVLMFATVPRGNTFIIGVEDDSGDATYDISAEEVLEMLNHLYNEASMNFSPAQRTVYDSFYRGVILALSSMG